MLALAVEVGAGSVEVLGPGAAVVAGAGVAASNEAADGAFGVVDQEGEPVAEPVDQRPGAGALREAGGEQLDVGGTEAAQVIDESGPAGGGVAGG